MSKRRLSLAGLLAVLLALMAQLGFGASVPNPDPLGGIAGVICHVDQDSGSAPAAPTHHPADCPVCPLCAAAHAPSHVVLPQIAALVLPDAPVVARGELPPPATAPPPPHRPPSQPRAPPVFS
jgi:hypothetical protein